MSDELCVVSDEFGGLDLIKPDSILKITRERLLTMKHQGIDGKSSQGGYRNYRDPVHNIISLDTNSTEGKLLSQVIDTFEIQRLRRIRQLGLAFFAYQGAEHSRFAHSLGTMHLAQRMLAQVERRQRLSQFERMATLVAALVHDVGHGPFSHTIEAVVSFHHEEQTHRFILDEATSLHQVLVKVDSNLPQAIVDILRGSFKPTFLCQIVSSQFDCDRLDYLLRDSWMTGVGYGRYDLEWLLVSLDVDATADTLFVRSKGLHAVEEFIQSRHRMFRQLYFHHAIKAAEAVFAGALKRAVTLYGHTDAQTDGWQGWLMSFLSGKPLSTHQFLALDDTDVMWHLKQWTADADAELSDLALRFCQRRLFKTLDVPADMPDHVVDEILVEARAKVKNQSLSPLCAVMLQESRDIPYFGPGKGKHPILVERSGSRPELADLMEVSEVVAGIRPIRLRRICCVEELRPEISKLLCQRTQC